MARDPEKAREARRRYRLANPEKVRETERRSRLNASEEVKERTRERDRRYRLTNRDRVRELERARRKRFRAAHPEKVREENRARAAAARAARAEGRGPTPETIWARTLKRKYKLSVDQWGRLLADQDGLCYLCGEPLDLENRRNIHVDHVHSCCPGDMVCGRCIRGLACARCNPGIAMFGDDPDRMEFAAQRLREANLKVAARTAQAPVQSELPILFEEADAS